jgi:hypothetical protein
MQLGGANASDVWVGLSEFGLLAVGTLIVFLRFVLRRTGPEKPQRGAEMFTLRSFVALLLTVSCAGTTFAQELASALDCDARWLRRGDHAHCEIRDLKQRLSAAVRPYVFERPTGP